MSMDLNRYLTSFKWGKPVLSGTGAKGAFDENAVLSIEMEAEK
jgi:hypothetical protein